MKPIDFAAELNPEQLAAVCHAGGPQLVLAGAGSGKTRVIIHRIAWLIRERGVDPRSIVAVTFTNKAAAEMRERAERLLELWPLPTFLGTFHRYSLQLLRAFGDRVGLARDFAILDEGDQKAIVQQAMAAENVSETSFPPRAILAQISSAKNRLLTPDLYERAAHDVFSQRVARVYRRYEGLRRKVSGVDFDDLILYAVRLFTEDPELGARLRGRVQHLLVDEFQDTNHAQLRLVSELAAPDGDLTAVGDEDQGIYRWRGADLTNILEFERHFPGAVVRKLERNYRSTSNILEAANAVISNNRMRRGKTLWTEAGGGEKLRLYRSSDEADEARHVSGQIEQLRGRQRLEEMAILVRTNAQTRAFEEEFFRARIPYSLVGGVRFYERAEIKDLVSWLRLLRNPRDNFSLLRVINTPPRGIGKTTVAQLEELAAAETGGVIWDLLELDRLDRFSTRAATALRGFRELASGLRQTAADLPLPVVLDELLARTGYTGVYRRDNEEDQGRLENIQEFLSAAQSFTEARAFAGGDDDPLTAFLDHVALVSDLDGWDGEKGITLMTLHSAKGLEFPIVFLPGLENGLLPHFNSQGRPEDVEEERRLFYVGLTRARERLLLSTCRRRRIAGRYQDQLPSPFLEELPDRLVVIEESPALFQSERVRGVHQFFDRPVRDEYSQEAPAVGPRRGSRVRHPTLGAGVVLDFEGEGDDAKLTVYFDKVGKKRLIAKYAALELV